MTSSSEDWMIREGSSLTDGALVAGFLRHGLIPSLLLMLGQLKVVLPVEVGKLR